MYVLKYFQFSVNNLHQVIILLNCSMVQNLSLRCETLRNRLFIQLRFYWVNFLFLPLFFLPYPILLQFNNFSLQSLLLIKFLLMPFLSNWIHFKVVLSQCLKLFLTKRGFLLSKLIGIYS